MAVNWGCGVIRGRRGLPGLGGHGAGRAGLAGDRERLERGCRHLGFSFVETDSFMGSACRVPYQGRWDSGTASFV